MLNVEWDSIGEDLKVRVKLVGGYQGTITKAYVGCQLSETDIEDDTYTLSDTVDTVEDPIT